MTLKSIFLFNLSCFVILVSIFFSCNRLDNNGFVKDETSVVENSNSENKSIPVMERTSTPDSIIEFNVNGLNDLAVKFNVDSSGHILKTIIIYHNGKIEQKIKVNKYIDNNFFQLIDWNFDGFKDISVREGCGSGGCVYFIWNYSNKKQKFIYNTKISEVIRLEMDSISNRIVCHYRAGYAEENWDTFVYQNDKLNFEKGLFVERWTDQNQNSWKKKTSCQIINGEAIYKIDSAIVGRN